MSNKHWCMPKYPFLEKLKATSPFNHGFVERSDAEILRDWLLLRATGLVGFVADKEHPEEQKKLDTGDGMRIEIALLESKNPALFIESHSLLNFIYESGYEKGLFKQAVSNFPIQWLCPPVGNIGGIDLRSIAFGMCELNEKECLVTYTVINNESWISEWDVDEIDELLGEIKQDYSNYKAKSLAVLTRIAAGAAVYCLAFPDYILNGVPHKLKPQSNKPTRTLRAAPEILEGATRTSVSMHIRAGHFKTLQHERFKRNEDGTPKVIFVRQTVVAGKLTPKTAVGL